MLEILLGRPGISIDRFNKGFNEEVIALRPLATSWKSGSGDQATQIYGVSKRINKETMVLRP